MAGVLYTIAAVLIGLWLIGFVSQVGGYLIHLLLLTAVVMVGYQWLTGRRAV